MTLLAGCGGESPPPPPPTPELPGCSADVADRRALLQSFGDPPRVPDPGPTERVDAHPFEGGEAVRWRVQGAEILWASAPAPKDLHVLWGEHGARMPALVRGGDAALWLPGPPERPAANDALLRRAGRPPGWFQLQQAFAALDAARMGRFGPVPSGRTIVHRGESPGFAHAFGVLDPRVDAIAGPPLDGGAGSRSELQPFATCKPSDLVVPQGEPVGISAPSPDRAPAVSPEPAPWTVALSPVTPGTRPAGPIGGWQVVGEATGAERAALPPGEGGLFGVGADGILALASARDRGLAVVVRRTPVTLWTPPGASPPWAVEGLEAHFGQVHQDPWWILTALGPRAVVVEPLDALGRPWTGPELPVRTAATVAEAVELLSRSP